MYGQLDSLAIRLASVDPLCECVPHPVIPYAVRVRPSKPCYYDDLRRIALLWRCLGVQLIMVREFEVYENTDEPYRLVSPPETTVRPPQCKSTWWQRMRRRLHA